MTLHMLAMGSLVADPASRASKAGKEFAIGSLRVATDDEPIFVSVVKFGAPPLRSSWHIVRAAA